MARKIAKKDLTQPDSFQIALARASEFISENKSKMYIFSGIACFFILTVAAWHLYDTHNENDAWVLYTKAHNATLKTAMSEADIDQNALVKLFEDVVAQYPKTKAAQIAYYRMGNLYYQSNNMEASSKAYEEYLKRSPEDSELTTLTYIGLGYCYETKKDYARALEAFEKAANTKAAGNFESINYRNIARIYEEMHNMDKAIEYYKKSLEKTSDPSVEQMIKRQMSSLG
jgi:tetratricopeptide (TPR) repeat protein